MHLRTERRKPGSAPPACGRERTYPLPGDIAIFNWDGGVPDHIGIVEKYLGGGQFQSVEGNTSLGNNSNGGEVMRRVRYLSQVDGFGSVREIDVNLWVERAH